MDDIKLPPLPEPDTVSLAQSGRSTDYINGYESGYERAAEQMQAYARQAVLMERELRREQIAEFGRRVAAIRASEKHPQTSDKTAAIRATNDAMVAKIRGE